MSRLQSTSLSAFLKINNLPPDGVINLLNPVIGLRVVRWPLLNIKTFKVSLTLNFQDFQANISQNAICNLSLFQRYQISHKMQTEHISVLIVIICCYLRCPKSGCIWRSSSVWKSLRGFNNRTVTSLYSQTALTNIPSNFYFDTLIVFDSWRQCINSTYPLVKKRKIIQWRRSMHDFFLFTDTSITSPLSEKWCHPWS